MTRHRLRLDTALTGLIVTGLAGWWLVDHYAWLTDRELGYAVSAILIVIGVLGVVLTLRRPAPAVTSPTTPTHPDITEGLSDGQEADPQP